MLNKRKVISNHPLTTSIDVEPRKRKNSLWEPLKFRACNTPNIQVEKRSNLLNFGIDVAIIDCLSTVSKASYEIDLLTRNCFSKRNSSNNKYLTNSVKTQKDMTPFSQHSIVLFKCLTKSTFGLKCNYSSYKNMVTLHTISLFLLDCEMHMNVTIAPILT